MSVIVEDFIKCKENITSYFPEFSAYSSEFHVNDKFHSEK